MGITLGSNIASLRGQRRLGEASESLGRVSERLASGQRINRASDDAAGLAISESLRSDSRVFTQGIRNVNDGISLLNIADTTLSSLEAIVERTAELAQQAASETLSDSQRQSLEQERQALTEEYQRIYSTATFNGRSVFSGTSGSETFQAGGNSLTVDVLGSELLSANSTVGLGTYSTLDDDSADIVRDEEELGAYIIEDTNGDGLSDIYAVFSGGETTEGDIEFDAVSYLSDGAGGYTETTVNSSSFTIDGDFEFFTGNVELDIVGDAIAARIDLSHDGGFQTVEVEYLLDAPTKAISSFNSLAPATVSSNGAIIGTTTIDLDTDGVDDRVRRPTLNSIALETQDTTTTTSDSLIANQIPELDSLSIATVEQARTALDQYTSTIEDLTLYRGNVGASLNRLGVTINVLEATTVNYLSAESRIRNADIAQESSELARLNIMQNTAASVLAQANQSPSLVLALLR